MTEQKRGWKSKYDRCNLDNDGYLVIFGEHYSEKESHNIIKEDNYDDLSDYSNFVQHIWLRFGFTNLEGEVGNGWTEYFDKPKSLRGVIKATILYNKKQYKTMIKSSAALMRVKE